MLDGSRGLNQDDLLLGLVGLGLDGGRNGVGAAALELARLLAESARAAEAVSAAVIAGLGRKTVDLADGAPVSGGDAGNEESREHLEAEEGAASTDAALTGGGGLVLAVKNARAPDAKAARPAVVEATTKAVLPQLDVRHLESVLSLADSVNARRYERCSQSSSRPNGQDCLVALCRNDSAERRPSFSPSPRSDTA